MQDQKTKKRVELAKRISQLYREMREILPLAVPPSEKDWESRNFKMLTSKEAEKLERLAKEIKKAQKEWDKLKR